MFVFMCEFETGLRKTIREEFPDKANTGCYFHYVKALWEMAKEFSLYIKKNIKKIKIFFVLKCFPFFRRKN